MRRARPARCSASHTSYAACVEIGTPAARTRSITWSTRGWSRAVSRTRQHGRPRRGDAEPRPAQALGDLRRRHRGRTLPAIWNRSRTGGLEPNAGLSPLEGLTPPEVRIVRARMRPLPRDPPDPDRGATVRRLAARAPADGDQRAGGHPARAGRDRVVRERRRGLGRARAGDRARRAAHRSADRPPRAARAARARGRVRRGAARPRRARTRRGADRRAGRRGVRRRRGVPADPVGAARGVPAPVRRTGRA